MRFEIPVVKRCCCCLPLRRGLIFWVYFKLAATILQLYVMLERLVDDDYLTPSRNLTIFIIYIAILVLLFPDVLFHIVFLIGAYRKNYVIIRVYYRYAMCSLTLELLIALVFVGFQLFFIINFGYFIMFMIRQIVLVPICMAFGNIVTQLYLVVLVRSAYLKLKNTPTFEFTNHASDPKCTAQIII